MLVGRVLRPLILPGLHGYRHAVCSVRHPCPNRARQMHLSDNVAFRSIKRMLLSGYGEPSRVSADDWAMC